MKIAVIADDLTGALDTGVQFTQWGFKTQLLQTLEDDNNEVIVINTETRNKNSEQAYNILFNLAKNLRKYDIIYKKIDSTLRGNPGAEIEAILKATNEGRVIVTPTYPATARRVHEGHLYIGEKAITETEYINEYKIKTSYIPEILNTKTSIHTCKSPRNLPTNGIIIIDSATEQDLIQIANKRTRVLAGSAGLADALCYTLKNPPPVLSIIGSIRSESRVQVNMLHNRLGAEIININTIDALNSSPQYELLEKAKLGIMNKDVIITSAFTEQIVKRTFDEAKLMGFNSKEVENRITGALADVSYELLTSQKLSGIVITGGATAKAIISRLGIKTIDLIDEVQPGIPVIKLDQFLSITKAGGFGQPDTLIQATQYLKRRYR